VRSQFALNSTGFPSYLPVEVQDADLAQEMVKRIRGPKPGG
jgi:hypothetical protein